MPEFVAFHEGAQSRVGLNLTRNVSSSTVLYAEWSGGAQSSLAAEAVSFGQLTGTLPVLTHVPLPLQEGGWRNEMSVGGSYAPGGEVVINLEYHDHEAGLSGAAWRTWFAAASAGSPGLRAALWYIRAYAQDQQEPVGRHAIFLRASWNDALVHDLELDGLASVSLQDGSAQAQFQATYDINEHWRLGGLVSFVTGSQTTEFGSQPQALTVLASLRRYF